jgi:uncharacterized protein (TIGR03089 family)
VPQTIEEGFGALLAAEPSRPFVTYYDERSGERSELSVRSLANWVAKTHHLLQTELGLGVDDTAWLALPQHWISVPILLGCATAGVQISDDPARADVAFGTPDSLRGVDVPDRFAIAVQRAAVGFAATDIPNDVHDYVAAVRPQADAWASVAFGATAADGWDDRYTRGELFAAARERAVALGLDAGARVLSTRAWTSPTDWLDALFAPLAAGGSVVYVAGTDDAAVISRRAEQERAGVTLPG